MARWKSIFHGTIYHGSEEVNGIRWDRKKSVRLLLQIPKKFTSSATSNPAYHFPAEWVALKCKRMLRTALCISFSIHLQLWKATKENIFLLHHIVQFRCVVKNLLLLFSIKFTTSIHKCLNIKLAFTRFFHVAVWILELFRVVKHFHAPPSLPLST